MLAVHNWMPPIGEESRKAVDLIEAKLAQCDQKFMLLCDTILLLNGLLRAILQKARSPAPDALVEYLSIVPRQLVHGRTGADHGHPPRLSRQAYLFATRRRDSDRAAASSRCDQDPARRCGARSSRFPAPAHVPERSADLDR